MPRSPILAATLVVAALALPAAAQETVTLRFAWPAQLDAEVTMAARFEGGPMAGMAGPLAETTQRMTVRPHAQGMVVTMEGGPGTVQNTAMGGAGLEAMMEEMESLATAMVIGSDGAFRGLENMDSMRAVMAAAVAEMEEATVQASGVSELMDNMLSEEVMLEGARMTWNNQVGRWAGRTLVAGDTIASSGSFPWPLSEEGTIATDERAWLAGRVPCTEEETEARCVELHLQVVPDQQAMAEAMRTQMARMLGPDVPAEAIAQFGEMDMGMEMAFVVVTDPATLLPHRITQTQTTTVSMPSMGMSQEQAMVQEMRYSYGG